MSVSKHRMSWDEVLGVGLLWLCKAAFLTFALIALVAALWVALPAIVFPNGMGWHDLSNMEILFLTGLVFLNARYVAKARKHSVNVRLSVYRYLLGFGLHTLAFFSAGAILYGFVVSDRELSMGNTFEYWIIIAYEMSLLILLFAIVPKGQLANTQASPENTPPESSTTTEGSTDNV